MIPVVLQSIEQVNNTTFTFWFKPPSLVDYTAGQFIEIFLPHDADDRGTHRWFTLSSSPTERLISITTRRLPKRSSFKKTLFSLQPGDTAQISQAMGDFVLPMQKSIPIIFLLRGIGATPARSMLKFLQDSKENRQISIVYSVKTARDALYTDLFKAVSIDNSVIEQQSLVNIDGLVTNTLKRIKKAPHSRIYVSGPEQFVEKTYERLLNEQVKPSSIVTDYFHGY